MKITIQFDPERITLDDFETIEKFQGDSLTVFEQMRGMRSIFSQHVIDADGQYLTGEEGYELLGKMSLAQLKETAQSFMQIAQGAGDVDPKLEGASIEPIG